jgi:hypothetical protein
MGHGAVSVCVSAQAPSFSEPLQWHSAAFDPVCRTRVLC